MLTLARVKHFQSVEKADLALAPFTVVVGASNSGKSAFLRALKVLASNTSSQGFVTVGQKQALIAVTVDGVEVWAERGPAHSVYGIEDSRFPKAGVTVPDEVQEALRMPLLEGESLNFAFQFDRPFLLDAPATKVAKVLGDLTNVTVLHEAVREANRRRLEASSKLKVRRVDEKDLDQQLESYRHLPAEKKRLALATELVKKAQELEVRRDRLANLANEVSLIERRLEELRSEASSMPAIDMGLVEAQALKLKDLRAALSDISRAGVQRKEALQSRDQLEQETSHLEAVLKTRLEEVGECPLCGATT